jgi:TPR repeat protein
MQRAALARGATLILTLASAALALVPLRARACEAMVGDDYSEPPETIEIGLDAGRWHVAARKRDRTLARKESVPAAQTLAEWSELVSWQVSFGPPRDLAARKDELLAQLRTRCASLESKLLRSEIGSLLFEWWDGGCYDRAPQHELVRLVAGTIGLHQLSYATRGGRMREKDRARWLERLSRARLASRLDGRVPSDLDRARQRIWAGDYAGALKVLRPLAESGNPDAQEELARLYVEGWGVAQDPLEAQRWFERAAAKHQPAALFNLGRMYETGLGIPADRTRALELFRAAAELGDAEAEGRVGYLSITADPPDYVAGRMWFERSAAHGHLDAVYWRGRLLDEGWGGQRDAAQALALYERAGVQGSAEAQYRLGRLYAIGSGVAQSDREAIKWLTRAAMQGQPEARAFYLYRYPKAGRRD